MINKSALLLSDHIMSLRLLNYIIFILSHSDESLLRYIYVLVTFNVTQGSVITGLSIIKITQHLIIYIYTYIIQLSVHSITYTSPTLVSN